MPLTDHQVLAYGSELRGVLKSPAFKAAVTLQRRGYQRDFFSSDYGDAAKREQAFRMNTALDDLLSSMSAFTAHADSLIAADEDPTEE